MLRNETAIESCNILKHKIESIIDKTISLENKKSKRSRKKHLSKEAIRKIQANYVEGS